MIKRNMPTNETRFIVYEGEGEALITTPALEQQCIKEWFTQGGRNILYYDRREGADSALVVKNAGLTVRLA